METPYTCYRTRGGPVWESAPRSPRFVDMVTGEPGLFDTRVAALWDDDSLYVSFWVEEPFVEAHLTERDSLVFLENDVEVFIDGGDCYYEFEINALGTVYEVFFIWQDAYERFSGAEFDVVKRKALSFAGDYDRTGATFWRGTHPRGARWAFRDWDYPGLRWSVEVDGYLNDRTKVSRGWRAEVAFPWAGMKHLANGRALPPRDGDEWRLFFGRFEKLMVNGREIEPHPAWCWLPHGVYDTHMPERWTRVVFSGQTADRLQSHQWKPGPG
jgi:hypothetical protein